MSSTGIRRRRSTETRVADSILDADRIQIENEKIFKDSTEIPQNSVGIVNNVSPAGNYLRNSGDLRLGPMGDELGIVEIIDDTIDVRLGANYFPVILLNGEGGSDDTLATIIPGEDVFFNQNLTLQVGNNNITLTNTSNIITLSGADIVVTTGEYIKLIFSQFLSAWIITSISGASGGDNLGNHTATEDLQMQDNNINGIDRLEFDLAGHSIVANVFGFLVNTISTQTYLVDGAARFLITNNQIICFEDLSLTGQFIVLDTDNNTTIDSSSDDDMKFVVGGQLRLEIDNTAANMELPLVMNDNAIFLDTVGDHFIKADAIGIDYETAALKNHTFRSPNGDFLALTELNPTDRRLDIKQNRIVNTGKLMFSPTFDIDTALTAEIYETLTTGDLRYVSNNAHVFVQDGIPTLFSIGNFAGEGGLIQDIALLNFNSLTGEFLIDNGDFQLDGTNMKVKSGGVVRNFSDIEELLLSNLDIDADKNWLGFKVADFGSIGSNAGIVPSSGFIRMGTGEEIRMKNPTGSDDLIITSGNDIIGNQAVIIKVASGNQLTISAFDIDVKDNDIVNTGDILSGAGAHEVGTSSDFYNQMHSQYYIPEGATIVTDRFGLAKTGNTLYVNYEDTVGAFGIFEQGIQQFKFSNPLSNVKELFIGSDPFTAGEEYAIQMGENSNASARIFFIEGIGNDLILDRAGGSINQGVQVKVGGLSAQRWLSAETKFFKDLNVNSQDIFNVGNIFADGFELSTIGEHQPSNGGFDYIVRQNISWESDPDTKISFGVTGIEISTNDTDDDIAILAQGLNSDIDIRVTGFLSLGLFGINHLQIASGVTQFTNADILLSTGTRFIGFNDAITGATMPTPIINDINLFNDFATGELSVKKFGGAVVSLEGGDTSFIGFTADADLDMNDFSISKIDRLLFRLGGFVLNPTDVGINVKVGGSMESNILNNQQWKVTEQAVDKFIIDMSSNFVILKDMGLTIQDVTSGDTLQLTTTNVSSEIRATDELLIYAGNVLAVLFDLGLVDYFVPVFLNGNTLFLDELFGTSIDASGVDSMLFKTFSQVRLSITNSNVNMNIPLNMNNNKITDVLNPTNPQDVVTKAFGDANYGGGGGGGANTSLSNLSAVAINTSLISDTAGNDSLGSVSIPWSNVHSQRVEFQEGLGLSNARYGMARVSGNILEENVPFGASYTWMIDGFVQMKLDTNELFMNSANINMNNKDIEDFNSLEATGGSSQILMNGGTIDMGGAGFIQNADLFALTNLFIIFSTSNILTTMSIPTGDELLITEGGEDRLRIGKDIILDCDSGDDIIFKESLTEVGKYDGGLNSWVFSRDVEMKADIVFNVASLGVIDFGQSTINAISGNEDVIPNRAFAYIKARINGTDVVIPAFQES